MAVIWYVHGCGGSPISFTWLQEQLPYDAKFFSYQVDAPTQTCIDRFHRLLVVEPEPVIVLGHSLGGIIGAACAGRSHKISHLITLCAPFGGLPHANLLALFSSSPIFRDLRPYSPLLMNLRSQNIRIPHLAIVASQGMPHMSEPNDGAVTVASQTALPNISYQQFSRLNHFEVLLSPLVAIQIKDFLAT